MPCKKTTGLLFLASNGCAFFLITVDFYSLVTFMCVQYALKFYARK